MVVPERVYQRAIHWADRDETTGCLVSRYSIGSHGYAQIGWTEGGVAHMTLVHRVVWLHERGPIPDGMTVDHEDCHNQKCAEVNHLRLLTNLENARRNRPGRNWELGTCIERHGPEFWRPKQEGVRLKGYCSECRRERRNRI